MEMAVRRKAPIKKTRREEILKSSKVFVPGGMPYHTYVARTEKNLEGRLRAADDNLCKLVTVTGATKSGKTVLTNKIFPRENGIWIDGGTIGTEDDLWTYILEDLKGYSEVGITEEAGTTTQLTGDIEGEIQLPLIAKGKALIGTGLEKNQAKSRSRSRSLSPRSASITQLRKYERPLIIDDFHYIDRTFQGNIVRALKPLIFDGLPVILIAIPHRRYDAVKVERELTGRLESISIPPWDIDELLKISSEGFKLLNVDISDVVSQRLAEESYGSPHLMQEFCRELCRDNGITETQRKIVSIKTISDRLFTSVAEGTGKVIFDKLAKGPRQRSDRMQRTLKSGETADIYKVTLYALADLAPGLDTIEYEDLRGSIRKVLRDNIPQAHEVTRVLEKMTEIAADDEASTPVIDWEKEEQKLHITDPFFAFYLRWGVESP